MEKYKTIWTKIEDLKEVELNVLAVSDNTYIKTKIAKDGDGFYTNFCRFILIMVSQKMV